MCLSNNKGIALDVTGWMILMLVALVVLIAIAIIFGKASDRIIGVFP